jgi:ribonuclease HI
MAKFLVGFSKENYVSVVPTHFNSIIGDHFFDSTLIFTNGSKSLDRTGFGVYSQAATQLRYRLQEPSSVFSAEIQAINHAIEVIKSHPPGEYLILTDSLSSMESMKSRKITTKIHPIVNVIKDALWNLHNAGYCVRFMWIPSHCNISGNEEANRLAREGSESLHYARAKPVPRSF